MLESLQKSLPTPILGCEIKVNEPMAMHTSFKIGGPCNLFAIPRTENEVKLVTQYAMDNNLPLITIGNGTNILFPDEGFYGIVMRIAEPYFCDVRRAKNWKLIYAGAGISISRLLKLMAEYGLSGLEYMAGIPGTLGGAIVMNAGAQGKRVSEVIERVKVMDQSGTVYWVNNQEVGFDYRESRFKKSGEIVLGAELNLVEGKPTEIRAKIQEILRARELKLPIELPSAGCVFKNPQNVPAGKLIELAGCKGLRMGGAQVSSKHANFIINLGSATYQDVIFLIEEVRDKVYKKFKIALEPELVIL